MDQVRDTCINSLAQYAYRQFHVKTINVKVKYQLWLAVKLVYLGKADLLAGTSELWRTVGTFKETK